MENQTSTNNPASGKEEIDLKQKAYTHLAQGKRHLLVKDYYEAANSLADACTFFDKLYGTGANECGEVYFNYGKALLELGRSESNVVGLGDNPEGKDDESDSSSDEDANENAEDEHSENDGEVKSDDKSGEPSKGAASEEVDPDGEVSKMEASGTGEVEDDEVEDNLKLAWEVLELAKTIFERQSKSDKQFELKLAEVYFKLCEVGLESGVYDQAIEDMKVCVDIQKRNLKDDDRILAESYYELGIAYSLKNDYDAAVIELERAIEVLSRRLANLRAMQEQGVPAEVRETDPFYSIEGEIKELDELVPEIRDKIGDLKDAKKETVNYIRDQLLKEQLSPAGDGPSGSSGLSTAPEPQPPAATTAASSVTSVATDISHLVRKKRKVEGEASTGMDQKQACTEATADNRST